MVKYKKRNTPRAYKPIPTVPIHVRLKEEGTPIDTPDKAIMSAMILHMDSYETINKLNKLIATYPEVAKEVLMSWGEI